MWKQITAAFLAGLMMGVFLANLVLRETVDKLAAKEAEIRRLEAELRELRQMK